MRTFLCKESPMNKTQGDILTDREREYVVRVRAACGYLELKMDDDAWMELDALCAEHQLREPVIKMRWYMLMRRRMFSAAARVARAGLYIHPRQPVFLLLASHAYEKMCDLQHALETWEKAPLPLRDSGFVHYHSARYAALLGRLDLAREHLNEAIAREPRFSFTAISDRVLAPLIPACPSTSGRCVAG